MEHKEQKELSNQELFEALKEKLNAKKPEDITDEEATTLLELKNTVEQEAIPESSSYRGPNEEDLNVIQRLEKWTVEKGFTKPGHELFSPKAIEEKKKYLPYIVGAAGLAVGAANPLARRLVLKAGEYGAKALGLGGAVEGARRGGDLLFGSKSKGK